MEMEKATWDASQVYGHTARMITEIVVGVLCMKSNMPSFAKFMVGVITYKAACRSATLVSKYITIKSTNPAET